MPDVPPSLYALWLLWNGAPTPAPDSGWQSEAVKLVGPTLITAAAALAGVLIAQFLTRRAARRAPKTELRARAYGDFVAYYMGHAARGTDAGKSCPELNGILARLLVYGESEVLSAVSVFLTSSDQCDLADVIAEMRGSVRTNKWESSVVGVLRHSAPALLKRKRPPDKRKRPSPPPKAAS